MQRYQPVKTERKPLRVILVGVPFFFLIGSILFNVIAHASVGPVGGELYAITIKTEQIHSQNQKLQETLALKQSLRDTLAQAESLGFVPVTKLTQVNIQDTKVALGAPPDAVHE